MSNPNGPDPDVRDRLLEATRRAAQGSGRGPAAKEAEDVAPGDLFVFHATADYDVEWLYTAAHPDAPPRARLVAAVPEEGAGSGDVEIPEDEPGGPLQVRCRHRLWVPAAMLEPTLRSGRVALRWAAEAERLCAALESGRVRGTPLQRETDEEADYRDRDRELAAAREALAAAAAAADPGAAPATPGTATDETSDAAEPTTGPVTEPVTGRPPATTTSGSPPPDNVRPIRPRGGLLSSVPVLRMAAAFLLVALGLTTWFSLGLVSEVEELGAPQVMPSPEPGEVAVVRGEGDRITARTNGEVVTFRLAWDLPRDRTYRVELLDQDAWVEGREQVEAEWLLEPAQQEDELLFSIRRSQLPKDRYLFRIVDVSGGTGEVRHYAPFVVTTAGSAGGSGPGSSPGSGPSP